jgi:hypothetical protein
LCAHEELIRPNEAALLNNLIVVVWESTYCSQCCHRYFYLGLYNKLNAGFTQRRCLAPQQSRPSISLFWYTRVHLPLLLLYQIFHADIV